MHPYLTNWDKIKQGISCWEEEVSSSIFNDDDGGLSGMDPLPFPSRIFSKRRRPPHWDYSTTSCCRRKGGAVEFWASGTYCEEKKKCKFQPPKFRTSKRKEFFRTPKNLQQLSGHETATPLHCNENEGTSRSNQCKKRFNEDNPDCFDVCDVKVYQLPAANICVSPHFTNICTDHLPRLHIMDLAYAAQDLMVPRPSAMTFYDILATGTPSILTSSLDIAQCFFDGKLSWCKSCN